MNAAVLRPPADADDGDDMSLRAVTMASLDELLAIERQSYEFPWSRVNFVDTLVAGYRVRALVGADEAMRAYYVAMSGVEETHLLNLTVAAAWRRRGLARRLLDELVAHCRERGERQLWLEVRASNAVARALYQRYGFRHVGLRRGYYPARGGQREDALVMGLPIDASKDAPDALV